MNDAPPATVRVAHYSDIHVSARPAGWRLRDFFSKRATGWVNVRLLGRGARFRDAAVVTRALAEDVAAQQVDHQVFSGDATTMGFPSEFEAAARLLAVGESGRAPGVAVPGNHDRYIPSVDRAALFERAFAPWQSGERIGHDVYPFAQRVGPFWLIALNSARPNFLAWDARGGVGVAQRERFVQLLASLPHGPRIVVTHYPLYLPNGNPESHWRRLRDWRATLAAAAAGGVCLWLHGHRHLNYSLPAGGPLPFPTVCAGSATQRGRWTYNLYELSAGRLRIRRRRYDPAAQRFHELDSAELLLP